MKKLFLIFLSLLFCYSLKAQENLVNISVANNILPLKYMPIAGLGYERKINSIHAITADMLFYSKENNYLINNSTTQTNYSIRKLYMNVPLTYKYYFSKINFSIGPSVNYMISWKQTSNNNQINIQDYKESPIFKLGYIARAGTIFTLKNNMFIEPEIQVANMTGINFKDVSLRLGARFSLGLLSKEM